jgi:hypothetical protein
MTPFNDTVPIFKWDSRSGVSPVRGRPPIQDYAGDRQ